MFGLRVAATFPAPWLPDAADEDDAPGVELRRVARRALREEGGWRVVSEQPLPRGSFTIEHRDGGGFRFEHAFYGRFEVAPGGAAILCAPNELPDWLWQRFVVAQPLPLAAVLHGFEPLHASAVLLGGRAVLLVGPSGAGKSSVALHLAAGGGTFVADDVAALSRRDDDVLVHPGPRVAGVDVRELARLPGDAPVRWPRLGALDGEAHVLLGGRAPAPAPVRAVYVLRRAGAGGAVEVGPPASAPPKVLLGGTFNAYVREPRRLARQLDVAGRLAATAAVREVRIPTGTAAADVAAAVAEDVTSRARARRS